MTEEKTSFKRSLGLLDATMIVAGSMIGSGIFIVSADITRNVGSAGWLIFVWVITGFMTVTAALSYGELGGKLIQTTFTTAKLLALFALIIFGFLLTKNSLWDQNWQGSWNAAQDLGATSNGVFQPAGWKEISGGVLMGAIAAAMVGLSPYLPFNTLFTSPIKDLKLYLIIIYFTNLFQNITL